MAEPALLATAARLVPLPVRDPNQPIADGTTRPPERRPARPGPDGFQAPALPGADLRLSNGIGIRPPARPGSSGAALGPVAARPRPSGMADQPRNPGDIGAAPRLEQRPAAPLAQQPASLPAGAELEQRFEPPQRLLELFAAQRGREAADEIVRQTRGSLFTQPDLSDTATRNAETNATAGAIPEEPGPDIESGPATDDRPAFQRVAELAGEFRAQDARRIFAAVQADRARSQDLPPGQPARQRILIDQRV